MSPSVNGNVFRFCTKCDQTLLLGKKATNLRGLLEGIKTVPSSSIYYHTHRFLQQHHYLSPEPPNDFGYWVTNILNESALGEVLSSVDIVQFRHIGDLRARFVEIMETYLDKDTRRIDAPTGEEFYFMSSRVFVLQTPHTAHTVEEFRDAIRQVSIHSIYFHVFDAHLRLEQEENDFSIWFRKLGMTDIADQMRKLDPYTQTLEGLRQNILRLVDRYGHAGNAHY